MTAVASNSSIRVLPPELIARIAAGEVIERPCSVLKELVENALDAGASKIVCEIEAGGMELIRVSDDGCGMSPSDLALAVQPHATSKLHDALELHTLKTLGFRGEALPSIASVSHFSIVSCMRSQSEGEEAGAWRIEQHAGVPPQPLAYPAAG